MSLINRMLGDLAARQAPGTETLSGVRLNEPLADARARLSTRTQLLVLGVVLGVAMLVLWLWPRPTIPLPQPRGMTLASANAPAAAEPARLAEATAAEAAVAPSDQEPPAQAPISAASAPAPMLRGMSLRLDASLIPPPTEAQTAVQTPPVERSKPASQRSAPEPVAPPASAPEPSTPIEQNPLTQPVSASASTTRVPDVAARKREARDALARGEPALALGLLEAAATNDDADVEALSLRAAALQRLDRHVEAADAYRRLTLSDAREPGHWVGLAISLERLQRLDEAHAAYRRALQTPGLAPPLQRFAQQRLAAPESP